MLAGSLGSLWPICHNDPRIWHQGNRRWTISPTTGLLTMEDNRWSSWPWGNIKYMGLIFNIANSAHKLPVDTITSTWTFTNRKLEPGKWPRDACTAAWHDIIVINGVIFGYREMSPWQWMNLKEGLAPNINFAKLGNTETQSHSISAKEDIHPVMLCWARLRNTDCFQTNYTIVECLYMVL